LEESDAVCGLEVSSEVYLDEGVSGEVLHLENRAGGGSLSDYRVNWYGMRTSLGCRKLSEKVKVEVEPKSDWVQNVLAMQRP